MCEDEGMDGQTCVRCGRCCTHVGNVLQIAAPEEWEAIIEDILSTRGGVWSIRCRCSPRCNHSWEGVVRELEDLPRFLLEDIRPCPFLVRERDTLGRFTGTTRCVIYKVRPLVCRLYPMSQSDADIYACRAFSSAGRARSTIATMDPTSAPSTLNTRSRREGSRSGTSD